MLLAYLSIISVAFIIIGISIPNLVGDYLFSQRVKEDQRIAETFSEQMSVPFSERDADSMYNSSLELCADSSNRILILDSYGVVQVDTLSKLNGRRFGSVETAQVLSGASQSYGLYDDTRAGTGVSGFFNSFFSYARTMTGIFVNRIYSESAPTGAIVFITEVQDIFESLRSIRAQIFAWLVIVALAVMLMVFIVLRSFTRPIDQLQLGIKQMTKGDFTARVNVRGHNEFTDLAVAFNTMSEKLQALDSTRNQFVSDASHELKTPLSTIKILVENILYQDPIDPGMAKEFLGDVNREIDRLNRTISDLLTLVNVERREMKLNYDNPDITELMMEQVRRLAPLARENGIELDCTGHDALVVAGDRVKLEQVIYNIIDNAIKYTPRGGSVTASATRDRSGRNAVIQVSDSGIGIPEKDLPHIFERFYRVDKARSRVTGGTGLGLSIVYQIVQLHDGTIKADSEEGKGTTFTITLPLLEK